MKFLLLFLLCVSFWAAPAEAVSPHLEVSGRITKPDQSPLLSANVSFLFLIYDPAQSCLLYQEQIDNVDMSASEGQFNLALGSGTVSFPTTGSLQDIFSNSNSLSCYGSGTYTPASGDDRELMIRFYDFTESTPTWRSFTTLNIHSVPSAFHAGNAEKLNNHAATEFVQKSEVNGNSNCSGGQFLTWDATTKTFGCAAVAASGTVTSLSSANSYLGVANGTTTPVLTLHVGQAANTVAAGDDPRITGALQSGATAGGDLAGSYPNPSVAKILNVGLSFSSLSSGQFLKYNGTSWVNATLSTSDVSGLSSNYLTQSAFNSAVSPAASCTAAQSMYWNSVSSAFACQNIAVTGTQVSGNIAGNAAGFTGSLAGDVTGTQGATKVVALQNNAVSASAPSSKQVLAWNGSAWAPAAVSSLPLGASTATSLTTSSVILKDSGSNTVTLQTPTTISNSYVLKFPTSVAASSGQVLTSDASGNLSWTTPSTTATAYSGVLPVANGGTNSSTALNNNRIMISNSGAIKETAALTDGQLLIGSTGNAPTPATITAGTGVSVTNGPGTITISSTGTTSLADGKIWVGQSGTAAAVTPSGDITMDNAGVVSVTGVKGKAVSAAPTTAGQVLRYNGTSWTPNFVGMQDLRSNVTGTTQLASTCGANQTLTYNSALDNLTCTNIAITDSQVTYTSQSQGKFLASPAASSGTPSFRTIASTDLPSTAVQTGGGTVGYVPAYTTTSTLSGSSPLFVSGSNVGVGTTAPAATLDVNGAIRANGLTVSGCPSGFSLVPYGRESFCISSSDKPSADWFSAFNVCVGNQARLCSPEEYMIACNKSLITSTAGGMYGRWTSTSAGSYSGDQIFITVQCGNTAIDNSIGLYSFGQEYSFPYRCCTH